MISEVLVQEVREEDISHIVNYWKNSSNEELLAMGIDINNAGALDDLGDRLKRQLELPVDQKAAFVLVAFVDEEPIGHCYVNNLNYGKDAFMHLHIWKTEVQKKGMGTAMVRNSIPLFFEKLKLQTLICEPAAMNPAPNRTLEKLGFKFIKKHVTIPAGWTFELEVNRWEMTFSDSQNID